MAQSRFQVFASRKENSTRTNTAAKQEGSQDSSETKARDNSEAMAVKNVSILLPAASVLDALEEHLVLLLLRGAQLEALAPLDHELRPVLALEALSAEDNLLRGLGPVRGVSAVPAAGA